MSLFWVMRKDYIDILESMFRVWLQSGARKWLVGLLVSVLVVPASGLYAMPGSQTADISLTPCHHAQNYMQTDSNTQGVNECCDTLHQCDGNCDHECSDCFSTGHFLALVTFSYEPPPLSNSHSIPLSSYHTGIAPTNLLRPPCQFV